MEYMLPGTNFHVSIGEPVSAALSCTAPPLTTTEVVGLWYRWKPMAGRVAKNASCNEERNDEGRGP